MRCTYDNSLETPAVRDALAQRGLAPPPGGLLGDEPPDELWLGVFGTVIDI